VVNIRATVLYLKRAVLYRAGANEGHDDGYHVDRQLELQELGDRVVHVAAPHHGFYDRREIVVSEDDVRCFFRYVRTSDALCRTRRVFINMEIFLQNRFITLQT
jgi:hypothetical protein